MFESSKAPQSARKRREGVVAELPETVGETPILGNEPNRAPSLEPHGFAGDFSPTEANFLAFSRVATGHAEGVIGERGGRQRCESRVASPAKAVAWFPGSVREWLSAANSPPIFIPRPGKKRTTAEESVFHQRTTDSSRSLS